MLLPRTYRALRRLLFISGWLSCIASSGPRQVGADEIRFSRDILPILSDNCFACHGPDESKREAGFRLDVPGGALQAADSGDAPIVPGQPNASPLIARIFSDDADTVMPPPDSRKKLTPAQKDLLKNWIGQGARFEQHWAFVAPIKASIPSVRDESWIRTPIDQFLLAQLEREGLAPRPEADRATLIRRAALALTGLPPTLTEVDRFLNDVSPLAYEAMVQRYLDSPRFGEEMARHWLDVARYADTHGLHLDNERQMWAYRDWVIRAFNQNLPFDQFTVEQLAGDLLPDPTTDQLVATGFNRCNVTTSEGGSIEPEFLYRYAVDRASTMAQAWLGLTAGCAVCHDHKFDPLTAREFYSLYAFFYSAADPAMDKNARDTEPYLLLPSPRQKADLERLREQETASRQRLEEVVGRLDLADPADSESAGGLAVLAGGPARQRQFVEDVWLDDVFPLGAKVTNTSRNASTWTGASEIGGPMGQRALRQASAAMFQDKFDNPTVPLFIPDGARFGVWIRLDSHEPPEAIMLELNTTKGVRRAIWGDAARLGSGTLGTSERLRVGDLPAPGSWQRLEVTGEQLKLEGGETARGVALAQFGGVVHWDGLSVRGETNPASDPRTSWREWWKSRAGQDTAGVSAELQKLLRGGPDKDVASDKDTALGKDAAPSEDTGPDKSTAPDNSTTPDKSTTPASDTGPDLRRQLRSFFLAYIARPTTPEWEQARVAYHAAQVARAAVEDQIPGTLVFRDLPQPRQAHVMLRGQYDKPGDVVEPGVPAIFPPLRLADPQRRPNRLDLAEWLVAADHPLTARVAVNRLWQQFFGVGLVRTSNDFGSQGEPPSHPELLDWLAIQFRESGWNTKELVSWLVNSAAFRQDAKLLPDVLQRDPENRLYARGPRFRLDAEQIRDGALFVGGLLNLEMGGRGVMPYQPPNIWEPVGYADSNTRFYLPDHGMQLYRRSIYCFLKRTAPPPFMSNFDGPNREQFCARRERSNTPLQALQLMNDIQHFEAARHFAERILSGGGETAEQRITYAYRVALSRPPAEDELVLVRQTLDAYRDRYRADEPGARKVVRVGESPSASGFEAPELAAYTLIANVILNLDETVTRN